MTNECRFLSKKFLSGYVCTAVTPPKKLTEEEKEKCKNEEYWKDCKEYKRFFSAPRFKFR